MRASRSFGIAVLSTFALAGCASTAAPPPEPRFFPSPPDRPRLQLLKTYQSSDDIEAPSWFRSFVFGSKADAEKIRIGKPYGSALYDGKLYVCDSGGPVLVFDFASKTLKPMDSEHPEIISHPIGIAIAEDGTKYITDTARHLVIVYDKDDKYKQSFDSKTPWRPVGIATIGDRLYVTDVKSHCVHVIDRNTGEFRSVIGKNGDKNGDFYFPLTLAIDREANVYVTDSFNFRVQKFDRDGKFLDSFGTAGRGFGQFARPRGVAVDHEGRIYVVDAGFNNVQIFDKKGRPLLAFGGLGDKPGDLYLPAGIHVDYDSKSAFDSFVAPGRETECVVVVLSQYGPNKVSVYGVLKPLPGQEQDEPPPAITPRHGAQGETPRPGNDATGPAKPGPSGEVEVDETWLPDGERKLKQAPKTETPAGAPN